MARIFSSGFELNSATALMEWQGAGGSPVVQSATVRSGTYALRISSLSSGAFKRMSQTYIDSEVAGNFYFRFYFRVATLPTAENRIAVWNDGVALTSPSVYMSIDNSGVLRLYDEDGQITGTSTLSTNTWYRIEVHINTVPAGGSHVVEARVDGAAAFASASNRNIAGTNLPFVLLIGGNLASEAQTTGDWFFDDVAINNTSGSSQTSWPGEGRIVHLRPSAAGDNNNTSGTFASINEVTPNDGTSIATFDVNNDILDVNVQSGSLWGIGSSDDITLIHVGARYNCASAASAGFKIRLKSAASGTLAESAALTYASTTYRTNIDTGIIEFPLTSYTDPTTAVAWEPTGTNSIENMQIGMQVTDADPDMNLSTLWALVEYVNNAPDSTTFPQSSGAVETSFSSSVTSMPVVLPGGIESGNLLIAVSTLRNACTWTLPSGWNEFAGQDSGGVGEQTVFYKIADGTEGGTATWTASTVSTGAWHTRRIWNWHGSTAPERAVTSSGGVAGTESNPPSLTPSWGADNTLWIAVGGAAAESVNLVSAPTNYSDVYWTNVSAGGSSASTGTALRELNASSEDPGTYDTDASRWWMSATIAVRPPEAGGAATNPGYQSPFGWR